MPITMSAPATSYRLLAYTDGAAAALSALHAETSPGILPVGPSGHTFLPSLVYATSAGPRPGQRVLDRIVADDGEWIASHVPGGGPDPDTGPAWTTRIAWTTGIAWLRLGLAERLLERAAAHLRGRTVAGVITLNLPMVRGIVADAAAGIAEARALLDADTDAGLYRVHLALDEAGRSCLHLFGAAGLLAAGPGSEVRVSELLADTYPPPIDLEAP